MTINRFFKLGESPSYDHYVAVAIQHCGDDQFHCGLVCAKSAEEPAKFVHLAWHRVLRCQTFEQDRYSLAVYWPNDMPLPEPTVVAIGRRFRQICKHSPGGIPYSFAVQSSINSSGIFVHGQGDAPGFTCATFVLAVLDSVGRPLVNESTWQRREEDAAWQEHILEELSHSIENDEQAALEALIGKVVRFRPSEVAAAATLNSHPAEFDDVIEPAKQIRETLAAGA